MIEQMNMFDNSQTEDVPMPIKGLTYIRNYITDAEHDFLLHQVDIGQWDDVLTRRVQHYGFKYDYKSRSVNYDMRIGDLPVWLQPLNNNMVLDKYLPQLADQVIVNQYLVGQGISSHIDCEPCFEDAIASVSLGSGCTMVFTDKYKTDHKIEIYLEPKSLIVLKGTARYDWMHGIPARKSDQWTGRRIHRKRRVSLTFRKVIIT